MVGDHMRIPAVVCFYFIFCFFLVETIFSVLLSPPFFVSWTFVRKIFGCDSDNRTREETIFYVGARGGHRGT
jgi:hypothetical protein